MATVYKLTDNNNESYGGMAWGAGVSHTASGSSDQELCTDGWIHCYASPILAEFLNPAHAAFDPVTMHCWESTGTVGKTKQQTKLGCQTLTTNTLLPLTGAGQNTSGQVKFAILCVLEVYRDAEWEEWADATLTLIAASQPPDPAAARAISESAHQKARELSERATALARSAQRDAAAAADLAGDGQDEAEIARLRLRDAEDYTRSQRGESAMRAAAVAREQLEESVNLATAAASDREAEIAAARAARSLTAAKEALKQSTAAVAAAAAVRAGFLDDSTALNAARAAVMVGEAGDALGETIDFVAIALEANT